MAYLYLIIFGDYELPSKMYLSAKLFLKSLDQKWSRVERLTTNPPPHTQTNVNCLHALWKQYRRVIPQVLFKDFVTCQI